MCLREAVGTEWVYRGIMTRRCLLLQANFWLFSGVVLWFLKVWLLEWWQEESRSWDYGVFGCSCSQRRWMLMTEDSIQGKDIVDNEREFAVWVEDILHAKAPDMAWYRRACWC